MEELKFLMVENIKEDSELIQQQLEKEFTFSMQVVTAKQDYIEILGHFIPDVILSGYYNDATEGNWALSIRNKQLPDVPFIVATPTFDDDVALYCINGGATNYISTKHLVRLNFVVKMALEQVRLAEQKKSMEKELEASLEHFKKFVDHDISGDYLEDENEVLFCNNKILEIFGFSSMKELNEFGTVNLYEDPLDRENLIKKLKTGKRVENQEFRMFTKTGKPIIVLENAHADINKDGEIVTMYGYLIDITDQRRYEELLKESENLFRSLTESTSASIAIYDKEYLLYTNPAFSKLVGYSQNELLKMHYWDVIHPDHRQMVKERGEKRVENGNVVSNYQFKVVTKQGVTRWVDFAATSIVYKDKASAIGTLYDITEQKKAAQEIKKLSTVIEQSPLSIIITDIDGNIEYANRAFLEKTGYSIKEVLGQNARILKSGLTPNPTYEDLWKTLSSRMVWKGNFINQKKDGTFYTEIAVIFPVFGDDGSVIRYAAIKRDVTQEKRIEEELLEEKKKVEEANRLKTAILTNMSHELRTPLNGILGFSTLISDSGDLEEIREMTQYIQESGQRLLRTLNLVIEVSAMEAGNFEADFQEIDLNGVIRKLVKSYKEEAVKKNLKIIFDDPLSSFFLVTDLKFIYGAIENLLDNAIKFTNEGWVSISTGKETKEDKDYVVVSIADTGIGISEMNQKVIFEDFQQESMGYSREYEGTGLGLSLTKKYVELLDGFIELESKVGDGSNFSIFLPVKQDLITN